MPVVCPPTPTDAFSTTTSNPGFFLALRLDEIVHAADEEATSRLWKLFNSCVNELEQGKRLENLSWRTWSRERTLYSRQRYSRLPLLDDDEAESRSPALTEDEDDGDGDSSNDSSGSDDSSDDAQSHQQQQQQHTKHLAPVSSVTVTVTSPVVAAPAAVAATATAEVVAVAVAPVVVATAAQSTTGSEQQHPLVTTPTTPSTPGSSGSQSRQHHHHHHHHHQCSASHPATGTHPKLLANPPPRRHYSHSLPYTMVAAAAAASVSPPIGQLIKRVIFNQSATMMTMTHNIDRPQHPPSLDFSDTTPKLHATTLSALSNAATPAATPTPPPTAPSISNSLRDRPTLTITESTPLPSVEPTPLPTPKPTGLSPFPYILPAPLGSPDARPQASDSHSAPVTTRQDLNPSTGHHPISHHRMFYLQYHSPDGSSSGGSHNSRSHLTPPTPGLPPSQNPPQPPQMSPSHVEAHHARSNAAGATRMSARKGKDSLRHGHVIPRNTSGRMTARIVHHHHTAGARRGVMTAKSDRSTANTLTPGSASSGASRKAAAPRRLAETVEQREVDDTVGRVGVIGPDLHMQKQHQVQQVGPHTPQRQVQLPHQSRSEPGTSTFTTTASAAAAGNTNASSSQTAVQDIKVKNVTGPMMRLITPGLFDGDKVKPEVLDQRVDAALKAALNGATGNLRRRIKLVSSSEHESDDDDDDEGSSWSDDESNVGEQQEYQQQHQKQQHRGPPHLPPLPSARKNSQTTESGDESDGNGDDDEHDGPLARAAKEAERQRNMFAKLPRESYADLRRKGIGAGPSNLTLLLNPPPEMFPHEHPYRILSRQSRSAGDIAYHHAGGFGYRSQEQQPSHAHYQYQEQQRGHGPPQQQMQRQKSQPFYGNGLRSAQYAVAPPPQPRQRSVTPVQAQTQHQPHPQQSNAKPPTRERIGGFGGFQFTVMHPVDPKASKQPAPAPIPAPAQAQAPAAQGPQQVAVAPPPSAAPRRASTGASRVASTPPVLLRSLSKSSALNPIIQQVTASSFKDAPLAHSAHSHQETDLSPKRATVSPRSGRPGNRLSARPEDVELSDSEDDGPEQAIPSPKSMIRSPKSPIQEGGAKAQLEAVMNGKPKCPAGSSATAVTPEGLPFADGQEPEAPIEFSGSVVPLRAPPSTPSRGTETCVNGEHLPRSPTTVCAEQPRPHSTYGTLTNCHESPPAPHPEHAHAGAPSTSEPTCGGNNNNAPIYPQPIEMPFPYNLPFPTHMLSPRTTRLKMLSSEMPPDLRNDLLWERKANRVHAVYRPMAGLRPLANAAGSGDEGASREPTEEERAAMAAEEARRRAMRNRTWAGVFPRPTAW